MPIQTNSEQGGTLEEFYRELSESTDHYANAIGMLEFINMINQTFKETQLWGLISHTRLVIQSEDGSQAKWYVIIGNMADYYFFQYLLPSNKQPWENARVQGEVKSLKEAKKYLLIAMNESEGWKGNLEVKKLLNEL